MRVSPHRLLIPLLVTFSLTGAGVILIYFLNKKKNEDEQNIRNNKPVQNSAEIKIPRQFVPAIIGRGGTMIQNIQQSTGTKISFKEENEVNLLERTCIIIGTVENIKLAEEKIKCILNNQPIIETYETWIPQRTIIKLMERGGAILNQIQNSSNAKIILESSLTVVDSDTKKRVIIKGTAEQIANALLQIEDKVKEDIEARAKAATNLLTRVPRIKTSPAASPENNSTDVDYAKEIFGHQGNEGLMEVFVCAIENPSQFYIQVIGSANALLDDLIKDMTEYYTDEENRELHTLKNITVGQMVAAKFPIDDKWYRAEIIADLGDELYDVYFVDFGDRDKIHKQDIFEMRTDFLSLRLQAIECSLAGVKPREGEWSSEATAVFGELSALANWQPRIAKIRGYKERILGYGLSRREGSPIPCIELYEKRDDQQLINIGKQLIKLDLACAENEPWSAASSTLSLSRRSQDPPVRSPEVTNNVAPTSDRSSGSNDLSQPVELIDLTLTPQPKSSKKIVSIDLVTPEKDSKTASRSLIESEKNSSVTSNGNDNDPSNKNLPPNPFKSTNKQIQYTIVPGGYESDCSNYSDELEYF